jgi:hypothetical protein
MSDYNFDAIQAAIEAGDTANVPPEFRDIAESYKSEGSALAAVEPPVSSELPEAPYMIPFDQAAATNPQRIQYAARMALETGVAKRLPSYSVVGTKDNEPIVTSDVDLSSPFFGTIRAGEPFFLNRPGMSWQDVGDAIDTAPAIVAASLFVAPGAALTAGGVATGAAIGAVEAGVAGGVVDYTTDEYRGAWRRGFDATVGALTSVVGNAVGDKAAQWVAKGAERALGKLLGEKTLTVMPSPHIEPDGSLSAETATALRRAGIDPLTVSKEVATALKNDPQIKILAPDAAYTAAVAKDLGIKPRSSALLDDPAVKAFADHVSSVHNEAAVKAGDVFTARLVDVGREAVGVEPGVKTNVPKLVQEAGDAVQGALQAGWKETKQASDALFDAVTEMSPATRDVVLPSADIAAKFDEVYSDERFGLKSAFAGDGTKIRRTLIQYGILGENAAEHGISTKPFSVDAARALLEDLNRMARNNPSVSAPVRELHDAVMGQVTRFAEEQLAQPTPQILGRGLQWIDPGVADAPRLAGQQVKMYKNAVANYRDVMGRWKQADLVYELIKPREEMSSLLAVPASDVIGKIRSSARPDVRRLMVALTDIGKSVGADGAPTAAANAAKLAREKLQTGVMMDGLEKSITVDKVTGQHRIDPEAFHKYFYKSMDAGVLEDIMSATQLHKLSAMDRTLRTHRIGHLNKNDKMADPADTNAMISNMFAQSINHAWLAVHKPVVYAGVLAGKAALIGHKSGEVPRAMRQELEGLKTATSFKNLTRKQQEMLLHEIRKQYPLASKWLEGSAHAVGTTLQKASRIESSRRSSEAEYRSGGY